MVPLVEKQLECLFTYYRFYRIFQNFKSAICHLFIVTNVTITPQRFNTPVTPVARNAGLSVFFSKAVPGGVQQRSLAWRRPSTAAAHAQFYRLCHRQGR